MRRAERAAAKAKGLTRYVSTRPCPRGHLAERFVSSGRCCVCTFEQKAVYRTERSDEYRVAVKRYRDANRQKIRDQERARRAKDPERRRQSLARWRKNNPFHEKLYLERSIEARIAKQIRTRTRLALREGRLGGSAVRDLGCSIAFLRRWIESQFLPGMSWDNRSEWHIDHRKPLSAFDLTNRAEFLKACHWSNLQPLWAADNLSKGARLPDFRAQHPVNFVQIEADHEKWRQKPDLVPDRNKVEPTPTGDPV